MRLAVIKYLEHNEIPYTEVNNIIVFYIDAKRVVYDDTSKAMFYKSKWQPCWNLKVEPKDVLSKKVKQNGNKGK